jgi:UTP--glucose-1-phosphate uridylyltransferase
MDSGAVAYVRQKERRGLGHAVWCARRLIGDEPFAVILPDDVIEADVPCLKQMVDAYAECGGNMVAAMEVPAATVSSYGILDVDPGLPGAAMKVRGMVEKPRPEAAPSRMAVIGRYILSPAVLENLEDMRVGAGGEIQLTDAIASEIAARDDVHAFRFHGRRFDCGSKSGFLQATVAFGLGRPELRDEFLAYLHEVTAENAGGSPSLHAAKR